MYDRLMAPGGKELMTEFFLGIQVWGTPEQVIDKIVTIQDHTYADAYMGVFSYAGMPIDDAEASMRLFAAKVMPELQALPASYDRLGTPA